MNTEELLLHCMGPLYVQVGDFEQILITEEGAITVSTGKEIGLSHGEKVNVVVLEHDMSKGNHVGGVKIRIEVSEKGKRDRGGAYYGVLGEGGTVDFLNHGEEQVSICHAAQRK